MARKRRSQTAFSLFAFQDIITSVTGIMVLITLILALELIDRVQSAPVNQTNEQAAQTRQTIEELKREIETLESPSSTEKNVELRDLPSLDAEALRKLADGLDAASRQLEQELAEAQQRGDDKSSQAEQSQQLLDEQRDQNDRKLKGLKQRIAETQKRLEKVVQGDRIYYKPSVSGKTIWLVEIQESGLMVARLGKRERPKHFMILAFDEWVNKLDVDKNAFLLLVKPGGESRSDHCLKLRGHGFEIGIQALGSDQEVIDPETGAGTP